MRPGRTVIGDQQQYALRRTHGLRHNRDTAGMQGIELHRAPGQSRVRDNRSQCIAGEYLGREALAEGVIDVVTSAFPDQGERHRQQIEQQVPVHLRRVAD